MTDGYSPHNEVARTNELMHLGCWIHARRYLVEAKQSIPKERHADHPMIGLITRIGRLFAIEGQAQGAATANRSMPWSSQRSCSTLS